VRETEKKGKKIIIGFGTHYLMINNANVHGSYLKIVFKLGTLFVSSYYHALYGSWLKNIHG
jgi:hypothetical protein